MWLAFLMRKRACISAETCSHGIPRSGCFRSPSARRSSSAICSGVGSGSYSSSVMFCQTRCANSIRSERLRFASISNFNVFHWKFFLGSGGAFPSLKPPINSSQRRCASSIRSLNGSFLAFDKYPERFTARDYAEGTHSQADTHLTSAVGNCVPVTCLEDAVLLLCRAGSFQTARKLCRIAFVVPHRYDHDATMTLIHREEDGIRPGLRNSRTMGPRRDQAVTLGVARKSLQECAEVVIKTQAQTWLARFIPVHRFVPLRPRGCVRDDLKGHLCASKRSRIAAETSSTGTQSAGLLVASSTRRSSSAISSRVKSRSAPPNSAWIFSAISCCSSGDKRRICSRISVALMAQSYPRPTRSPSSLLLRSVP